MPPVTIRSLHRPIHDPTITITLFPDTGNGTDRSVSPILPQTLLVSPSTDLPSAFTVTKTVSQFFTVHEVQITTVTSTATTTTPVGTVTATIYSRPTGPTRAVVKTSINNDSPTSSASPSASSSTSSTTTTLSTPTNPASDSTGSRLSSGGIAGVTLSIVLFIILFAVCFLRFRSTRRRERNRPSVTPFVEEKPTVRRSVKRRQDKRMEAFAERWERLRQRNRHLEEERSTEAGPSVTTNPPSRTGRDRPPARPPRHVGRSRTGAPPVPPIPPGHGPRRRLPSPPPVYREPSARRPVRADMVVASLFPHGAVAKLHFEPIRPDELEVRPGDYLRVIALYDDGWAQCKTVTGRKGMVPTACLRINDVRRLAH